MKLVTSLLTYASVLAVVPLWGVLCQPEVRCGERNKNCLVGEICINRLCRRLCANGGVCAGGFVCGKNTRSQSLGVEVCCSEDDAFEYKKTDYCYKKKNGDTCRADQQCKSGYCEKGKKKGECRNKPTSFQFVGNGFCTNDCFQWDLVYCEAGELPAGATCPEMAETYNAEAYFINTLVPLGCRLYKKQFASSETCPTGFLFGPNRPFYPPYQAPTRISDFGDPSFAATVECYIKR